MHGPSSCCSSQSGLSLSRQVRDEQQCDGRGMRMACRFWLWQAGNSLAVTLSCAGMLIAG